MELRVRKLERLELALGVPDGDVGVAESRHESSLLRVQAVELGGAGGSELDELLGSDSAGEEAVVEEQREASLDAWTAVRYILETVEESSELELPLNPRESRERTHCPSFLEARSMRSCLRLWPQGSPSMLAGWSRTPSIFPLGSLYLSRVGVNGRARRGERREAGSAEAEEAAFQSR